MPHEILAEVIGAVVDTMTEAATSDSNPNKRGCIVAVLISIIAVGFLIYFLS